MACAVNVFLFSRFKHFQFHVVDYPLPPAIVGLTQDQALLILHSRLPPPPRNSLTQDQALLIPCSRLPPLLPEVVSLTQDQALLISHSRLLSNCV